MAQPNTVVNRSDVLPATTHMGPVTLLVGDLDALTAYYRDAFLLEVLRQEGETVALGRRGVELLILQRDWSLPPNQPRSAGLYHTAFLFDSKAELATVLAAALTHGRAHYVGSGDHAVSEAFYFTDPEGNGVELYADRPRESWQWSNGSVHMTTDYLDPVQFLRAHLTDDSRELVATQAARQEAGALRQAAVGHVHLQVGDTATAKDFYVDTLGFETTLEMGNQALFVAAGGYHHHMAMNTWNSLGAG
ncbi:MAG TPA: VOC family protein, partial [Actinomycetaceae bacterium]|nr:VOC family protein [Actinomycetaceae bacterium]